MRKKNVIKIILLGTLLTLLMSCNLALDVPPHSWMIGSWKEDLGNSTLDITDSKIIVNYNNQEINLVLASIFVDIKEESSSASEYLIIYTKDGEVSEFEFTLPEIEILNNPIFTSDNTMLLNIYEDGVWSGATLYIKQAE